MLWMRSAKIFDGNDELCFFDVSDKRRIMVISDSGSKWKGIDEMNETWMEQFLYVWRVFDDLCLRYENVLSENFEKNSIQIWKGMFGIIKKYIMEKGIYD